MAKKREAKKQVTVLGCCTFCGGRLVRAGEVILETRSGDVSAPSHRCLECGGQHNDVAQGRAVGAHRSGADAPSE